MGAYCFIGRSVCLIISRLWLCMSLLTYTRTCLTYTPGLALSLATAASCNKNRVGDSFPDVVTELFQNLTYFSGFWLFFLPVQPKLAQNLKKPRKNLVYNIHTWFQMSSTLTTMWPWPLMGPPGHILLPQHILFLHFRVEKVHVICYERSPEYIQQYIPTQYTNRCVETGFWFTICHTIVHINKCIEI